MNKIKILLVTVLLAIMLAAIDIGLFFLYLPGFYALTGTLALYGFFRGTGDFCRWLLKDAYYEQRFATPEIKVPNDTSIDPDWVYCDKGFEDVLREAKSFTDY